TAPARPPNPPGSGPQPESPVTAPRRGFRILTDSCRALLSFPFRHPRRFLVVLALYLLAGLVIAFCGSRLLGIYHFRAGRSALQRCHNPEAAEHLRACLGVWPDDPATLFLAARAARRLGDFEQAGQFLDEAKSRAGKETPLADDLALERVLLSAERGEVEQVHNLCLALMKQKEQAAPLILEAMAHGYMRALRFGEADYWLHQWLEREPDNPLAFFFLALVQDDENRFLDA